MRFLILELLLCIILSCFSNFSEGFKDSGSIPQDVKEGFSRGRSGAVLFKPTSSKGADTGAIFLDKSGHFFNDLPEQPSVYDFADIVGNSLGLQPLSAEVHRTANFLQTSAQASSHSSLFTKAPATLLINLVSVGQETVNKLDLPNLRASSPNTWFDNTPSALAVKRGLTYSAYPQNSLAITASLVTGKAPSSHGVVASRWKSSDRTVDAYSNSQSASQTANLADLLSQTFDGKSMILSVSSDWQQAALNSLNPNLRTSHPASTLSMKDQGFEGDATFSKTQQQLLAELQGTESFFHNLAGPVTATTEHDLVRVSFPTTWGNGQETATFDLQSPADYTFLAEVQYIYSLPRRLESMTLLDNSPDLYTLTVASVTGLVEKYGRDSQEVRAALNLLDAALPKIVNRFSALYETSAVPSAMISEIVLLGSHPSSLQTADTREILEAIDHVMPTQEGIKEFFPSLYLENSQAIRLCESGSEALSLAVKPFGYSVYCPWEAVAKKSLASFQPMSLFALAANTSNSTVTSNDVQRYQIVLWMSIIMSFALFWIILTTASMSFKKDTLLYGTFNPNWEDRKRR
jgi:hypothetical protein